MKHISKYLDFVNEAIVVNKDARKREIEMVIDDVRHQIVDAGKRGQEYVILHFEGSDYSTGYEVMDPLQKEGLVKIHERGFGSDRTHSGYTFRISCVITDTSLIDNKAKDTAVADAINIATKQAEEAAAKGSDQVTLRFDAPTLSDGDKVMKALNKEGVECNAQGFGSNKNSDGSWSFRVSCTIGS